MSCQSCTLILGFAPGSHIEGNQHAKCRLKKWHIPAYNQTEVGQSVTATVANIMGLSLAAQRVSFGISAACCLVCDCCRCWLAESDLRL